MQTTHEGRATHNAVRIMTALAIATWLGAGCGKTEKPEPPAPESVEAAEAAEAPKAVETEKWEPETVKPQEAHGDHGHSHGPDGHTH